MKIIRNYPWLVVVGLTALFVNLALFRLHNGSIWFDESFTYMLSSYDVDEILRRTQLDVHPPLYYIILKGWMSLFGSSLFAMRSLSIVAAAASIPLLYTLVRQLLSRRMALLSAALLAINPIWVRYAQEARMYALAGLLVVFLTFCLVKFEKSKHRLWLVLYAVAAALSLLTHYYTGFVLAAHALWILYSYTLTKPYQPKELWKRMPWPWLVTWMGTVLLFAPWLPTVYKQFSEIQNGFWIGPVSHNSLYSTFTKFTFYIDQWRLESWAAVGAMMVAGVTLYGSYHYFKRDHGKLVYLVPMIALAPIIMVFILSLPPFKPVYNNRYFSLITPFIACLYAAAMGFWLSKSSWWRRWMAAAVIVGSLSIGLVSMYADRNFNSDNLTTNGFSFVWEEIKDDVRANDVLLAVDYYAFFDVNYHARHTQQPLAYAPQGLGKYGGTSLIYDREDILISDFSELTAERVWVVYLNEKDLSVVPESWQRETTVSHGSNHATLFLTP